MTRICSNLFYLCTAMFLAVFFCVGAAKARAAEPVPGSSWIEPVTGMSFEWVAPGCFDMGCDDKSCGKDERPVHKVCLNGFWIARTETTQGQWDRVMDDDPSEFKLSPEHPVERVSWDAAQRFVLKLSAMNRERYRLRLPSEAEWEYVCRMGLRNARAGALKSDSSTQPVMSRPANRLGIYGMGDNTAEWVQDVYSENAYSGHNQDNPIYSGKGRDRVYRGDCWISYPDAPRCSGRYHAAPSFADSCQGFRLAMSPDTPQPPAEIGAASATGSNAGSGSETEAGRAEKNPEPATAGQGVSSGGVSAEEVAQVREAESASGRAETSSVQANTLESLRTTEVEGRLALEFQAAEPFDKHTTFMLDGPPRMVLDLPGAWKSNVRRVFSLDAGNLKQARTAEHKDKLRVVFDFRKTPEATPRIMVKGTTLRAVFAENPPPASTKTAEASGGAAEGAAGKKAETETGARSGKSTASAAQVPLGPGSNELNGIRIYSRGDKASVELDTAGSVGDYAYFQLEDPPRVVLNLAGKWRSDESRDFDPDEPGVHRIVTKILPDMMRVTLELDGKPGAPPTVLKKENGLRVELADIPEVPSSAGPAAKSSGILKPAPHVALPPPNRLEKVDIFVDRGVMSIDFFSTQPVEDFSFAEREMPPGLVLALPGDWGVDIPSVRKINRGDLKQIRADKLSDRLLLTLVFARDPDPAPVVKKTPHGVRVVLPADPAETARLAEEAKQAEKTEPEKTAAPSSSGVGVSQGSILKPDSDPVGSDPTGSGRTSSEIGSEIGSDQVDKDTGFDFKPPVTADAPTAAQPMTGTPSGTPPEISGKKPPLAALEEFRAQLMFTCKMSSASYQTLVWKHGNVPDNELEAKIEPYKRVFEDIAFRKGSDVETWEKVQSPVYDLGVHLRRSGYEPTVCDNIRHFTREQLEGLYDVTYHRNDRAGFQQLLKTDLIGK